MTWRGPRTANNPLYSSREWRDIRKHWIRLRLPCWRCHGPIDYDGPRYLPNGRHGRGCKGGTCQGCRNLNPRHLAVGHIVSIRKAGILGWTQARTWALSNTAPEHQHCSNTSGASEGNYAQRTKQAAMAGRVETSRRW